MIGSRFLPLASAVLVTILAAAPRGAAAAVPSWCLPPLFEGGQRLHALPGPTVFWLSPALRQHELCHVAQAHPETQRAVLIGSSAVLGFPLPVEQTLSGRLNERLAASGLPGHVFNLGWVNPYQLRDAVILRAALDYDPDLIIYPLSLDEFTHAAPIFFPSLTPFFYSNDIALHELYRARPPGLVEPLDRYEEWYSRLGRMSGEWARLQDLGALARAAAHANADVLAHWVDPTLPPPTFTTRGREQRYDCEKTMKQEASHYKDWQSWNILAYLQQVHEEYRIPVIVVNWPEAHEPVDTCYNFRHSVAAVEEFSRFLQTECEARGLGYVNLHELLPAELFYDSRHPTAEGHRRIAEQLAPIVERVLRRRAAARAPATNE
jgi:hypothetical protein